MKNRVVILLVSVVSFFGMVLAIPNAPAMKPSRLAKSLPEDFGMWVGRPQEPSEEEKVKLAGDTEFERMSYQHAGGRRPSVEASIVFSGKNLSQSIHRPEVCLDAQGWEFMKQTYMEFQGVLPNGEVLPVKEMVCRRLFMKPGEEGQKPVPVLGPNGEKTYIWRVFYYTFFGHEAIVSGHYQRTLKDIKDRLFEGFDQRWAYATFSSFLTKKHADQGFRFESSEALDEEQTKENIQEFLKELLPMVISPPGQGSDPSLENKNDSDS